MTLIIMHIIGIWIAGVAVAMVQLLYWNKRNELEGSDYAKLLVLSLFSWVIYPAYLFVWLDKHFNTK